MSIKFDFDGDEDEEEVTFRLKQTRHWLTFRKHDVGYEVAICQGFIDCLNEAKKIHLGIKDVTNDGIAELLVAAVGRDASASAVFLSIGGDLQLHKV